MQDSKRTARPLSQVAHDSNWTAGGFCQGKVQSRHARSAVAYTDTPAWDAVFFVRSVGNTHSMHRYDRNRFFAFGVLQGLNVIVLLLYGLHLATRGTGDAGHSLPLLLGLAAFCLAAVANAAIKRGRDLGWEAVVTLLAFAFSLGLGPLSLLLWAYLALAKGSEGENQFGPPGPGMDAVAWLWALMALLPPWIAMAVAARLL